MLYIFLAGRTLESPRVGGLKMVGTERYIAHLIVYLTIRQIPFMEKEQKPSQIMNRTKYVLDNLTGAKSPVDFKYAEKMALRRLNELEKIVQGLNSKWFKGKHDALMIEQTKEEMAKIGGLLDDKRARFGEL